MKKVAYVYVRIGYGVFLKSTMEKKDIDSCFIDIRVSRWTS